MPTNVTERIEFESRTGAKLAARLDKPIGVIRAYALFAHCFTCTKDFIATRRIAEALTHHNIAVLRFDFTGLGGSGGDFANSNFASNVEDLRQAAHYMTEHLAAPQLLIGHSLGGAAILSAAPHIDSAKAVISIAAPAEAEHVIHNFAAEVKEIETTGHATVTLGGRQFTICQQFLKDLREQELLEQVAILKKPLLLLHSPTDEVVGIENAAEIYKAAKHPKSFISLDGVDHLVTSAKDAEDIAGMIALWSERYLPPLDVEQFSSEGQVTVTETGASTFQNWVKSGSHQLLADEPKSVGGTNTGPSPYDLLAAGLGACTSMTLRMYAERKKIPVTQIQVSVNHAKVHVEDCRSCEQNKEGKIDQFERLIAIEGDIDAAQRQRMLEIADRCPVHKTLESEVKITSKLLESE